MKKFIFVLISTVLLVIPAQSQTYEEVILAYSSNLKCFEFGKSNGLTLCGCCVAYDSYDTNLKKKLICKDRVSIICGFLDDAGIQYIRKPKK